MAISAELTDDPATVLARAATLLASDPVRHNVILTLLHGRVASPREGRYVIAYEDDRAVGVVFQSPLAFIATITPMEETAAEACVNLLAAQEPPLPGVGGQAGSAAAFAGRWTERTKSAAVPDQGQRIYEAETIVVPHGVPGGLRCAEEGDLALLVEWLHGFHEDTREPIDVQEDAVRRRVTAGQFWVWAHEQPVSMAAVTASVAGVSRVQAVYTPPSLRNRGYASACVANLSARTLAAGTRCILYTDLGNPTSNSVYRRIGYRAVAELLRYAFR